MGNVMRSGRRRRRRRRRRRWRVFRRLGRRWRGRRRWRRRRSCVGKFPFSRKHAGVESSCKERKETSGQVESSIRTTGTLDVVNSHPVTFS